MDEQKAMEVMQGAVDGDQFNPTRWVKKVNRTLKDMLTESVASYDFVTAKVLEFLEMAEASHASIDTRRKLLDTLAKATSMKVTACVETARLVTDIGKSESSMQDKVREIAKIIDSPFAKMLLERSEKLKKDDDDE